MPVVFAKADGRNETSVAIEEERGEGFDSTVLAHPRGRDFRNLVSIGATSSLSLHCTRD